MGPPSSDPASEGNCCLPANRNNWTSPRVLLFFYLIYGGILIGVQLSGGGETSGQTRHLSSNTILIVVVYALVIIPISLLRLHNVIDKTWRRVSEIRWYSKLYAGVLFVGIVLLAIYASIQFSGGKVNEAMAATVTCSFAVYGGVLHLRQRKILGFFHGTLQAAARRIRVHGVRRRELVHWENLRLKFPQLKYILGRLSSKELNKCFPGGWCYDKLSSSLFDDIYPCGGPRVKWLASILEIIDYPELVARAGLWICLAGKPHGYSYSRELQPKMDSGTLDKTTVDPASKKALWTLDVARLLFGSLAETDTLRDRPKKHLMSDFKLLVTQVTDWDGIGMTQWVKNLSIVPTREWAKVLSE